MLEKVLFPLFLCSVAVLGQDIEVPTDNCVWRGGNYGEDNVCEGNELPIGSCGSGQNDDCDDGVWEQLFCCDMPDFHYQDCVDYKVFNFIKIHVCSSYNGAIFHQGDNGQPLSCPEESNDPGLILEGACGSGFQENCDGFTHSVNHAKIKHVFEFMVIFFNIPDPLLQGFAQRWDSHWIQWPLLLEIRCLWGTDLLQL